jgi:hypothetical protein
MSDAARPWIGDFYYNPAPDGVTEEELEVGRELGRLWLEHQADVIDERGEYLQVAGTSQRLALDSFFTNLVDASLREEGGTFLNFAGLAEPEQEDEIHRLLERSANAVVLEEGFMQQWRKINYSPEFTLAAAANAFNPHYLDGEHSGAWERRVLDAAVERFQDGGFDATHDTLQDVMASEFREDELERYLSIDYEKDLYLDALRDELENVRNAVSLSDELVEPERFDRELEKYATCMARLLTRAMPNPYSAEEVYGER